MKKILVAMLFAPLMAFASGAALHLDKWPGSVADKPALQNGAKLLGCLLHDMVVAVFKVNVNESVIGRIAERLAFFHLFVH